MADAATERPVGLTRVRLHPDNLIARIAMRTANLSCVTLGHQNPSAHQGEALNDWINWENDRDLEATDG